MASSVFVSVTVAMQGPDLRNILRQSYDYLTIVLKLRWTYDGRLVYQTSYKDRKAFLRHDSRAREREREFIFHIAKTLNKYTTEMQN